MTSRALISKFTVRFRIIRKELDSSMYNNIKCWTSPGLKYIRWPGLFTTRALRKHRIRMDFIIYIVSFTIFHKHFIRIFPSAFYNPHFYHPYVIICTLSSVFLLSAFYNPPVLAIRIFYYPHFVIRLLSSACCHQHFIIRNYSSACWALHGNNSYQQGSKLFVWEIKHYLAKEEGEKVLFRYL